MFMQNKGSRIILLGRDLELRIISLIVRAREISQEVVFFDLGSNDMTVELAEEFDLFRIAISPAHSPSMLSVELLNK